MSRAELRRAARAAAKANKTYNLNNNQIQNLKNDATDKAVKTAFLLMLAIPAMVIHDKYSQIMKKEVDGKSREERFAELCLDLYECYEKGYVSLEDLKACLESETGMKVV